MKVVDVILIVTLFIVSFIPHVVFGFQLSRVGESADFIAIVTIDGEEVFETKLSEKAPHQEFTLYPAEGQYNIIEVDGNRIRNKEDNSPEQIGVRRGWISQPGESVIVLPHKLMIKIEANDSEAESLQDQGIIIPN